jgi:nickel/cobalt transporter (NiCoT) family protein
MMVGLMLANALVWLCAWAICEGRPALLGTALLAYGLGLRHAVDADHIAAIDNATRKMMEGGGRPVTLGMFFSLGHSTVVFGLTAGVAAAAATFTALMEPVRAFVSVIGAGLSSLFLVAVAAANLKTFFVLGRALLSERTAPTAHSYAAQPGGLMTRWLGPVSSCVTKSWHMLIVGFVFGLSFETASEISLLGLSVSEMSNGLSPWMILTFPALFAAGMSVLDAADGALMVGIYGWALSRPNRRLVYNIVITGLSVFVALLVAGVGLAGMIAGRDPDSDGAVWRSLSEIDMNMLGYVVVFVFSAAWLIAVVVSRLSGSQRWSDDDDEREHRSLPNWCVAANGSKERLGRECVPRLPPVKGATTRSFVGRNSKGFVCRTKSMALNGEYSAAMAAVVRREQQLIRE